MPPRAGRPLLPSCGSRTPRRPRRARAARRSSGRNSGRVLAVAVQQHDDVEVVLDGEPVPGLLVAAVAEVRLVADHGDRQVARDLLVAEADQVGAVLAGVVADEHLGDATAECLGDAVERVGQRRRGVVGDHQDADARFTAERTGGYGSLAWQFAADCLGHRPPLVTRLHRSGRQRTPARYQRRGPYFDPRDVMSQLHQEPCRTSGGSDRIRGAGRQVPRSSQGQHREVCGEGEPNRPRHNPPARRPSRSAT